MIKFSLAFPPRRLVRVIVFLICLIILAQVYFSLYLFRYTHKVFNKIDSRLGKIYFSAATFDIINGFTLHDVAIIDDVMPPAILFQAKRLSFGFNRMDIFAKKLNINMLRFKDASLYVDESSHTFAKLSKIVEAAYQEFLRNQLIPMDVEFINPGFYIRNSKIIFADWSGSKDGYWLLRLDSRVSTEGENIYSRGKADLEYKFAKQSPLVNLFKDQLFSQYCEYEIKGNYKNNDLVLGMFDIVLGYDHLTGQAIIKGLNNPKPMINLIVNSSNLSIENINSLVKDYDSRGTFNASAIVRGPIDNFKFIVTLNFLGCAFKTQAFPALKNIVGKVYWTGEALKIYDCFLIAKDVALRINADISWVKNALKVSAGARFKHPSRNIDFLPNALQLNFTGQSEGKDVTGAGELAIEAKDNNLYSVKLGDFKLSSNAGEHLFSAKNVLFLSQPVSRSEGGPKKLDFSELSANLNFDGKGLKVKYIRVSGLDGSLSADAVVNFSPSYDYTLHVKADNLNAAKIQEGLKLPYNLLGDISARMISDSRSNKFFEGALLIKNGRLQDTAVLLALSDYMKMSSLKAIDFDYMQLNFYFLKGGAYRYGVKSQGKEVILRANIQINKDNQLSSYLNAKFSQKILSESVQFRKLLKIIGEQSKFVEFPFNIGGTIHNPRLQWLRNDFKRSLERVIPAWYRRNMQNDINSLVDEMPVSNN